MNPFDYTKSFDTKEYLDDLSGYSAHIINKKLSFSRDTLIMANLMNMNHHLPISMQYDFYFHQIRPTKYRPYVKWIKKSKSEDVDVVSEYFGYSIQKAKQVLQVLTPDQLQTIKELLIKV
jgi:hypothetical protein